MKSICAVLFLAVALPVYSQVALTPSTPANSPSPVFVPGSPALTPPFGNTSFITTNASLVALAESLAVLQTNLQQTLPTLILFNDNFDFMSLGDNGLAATASGFPSGNFSANLGTNFASNAAVSTGMPTGNSLFNNAANRTTVSAAGLPQGFANIPVTRDTLRSLLVLQSDIQRMLPILNALNGGTANNPGGFTNLSGLVPTGR